jgi:hypothetical protein
MYVFTLKNHRIASVKPFSLIELRFKITFRNTLLQDEILNATPLKKELVTIRLHQTCYWIVGLAEINRPV